MAGDQFTDGPVGEPGGDLPGQTAWIRHKFIEDAGVKQIKKQPIAVEILHKPALARASWPEKKIGLPPPWRGEMSGIHSDITA